MCDWLIYTLNNASRHVFLLHLEHYEFIQVGQKNFPFNQRVGIMGLYVSGRKGVCLPGMNFCHFWSILYLTQWFPEGNIMICSSKKKILLATWDWRPKTWCDWATTVDMVPGQNSVKTQRSRWACRSAGQPRPAQDSPLTPPSQLPPPPTPAPLTHTPAKAPASPLSFALSLLPASLDEPQVLLPTFRFLSPSHQTTRVSAGNTPTNPK